jgi:hypothetical protein
VIAATVFCGTPQNNKNTTIIQRISRDDGLDSKKLPTNSMIVSFVFILLSRRSKYLKMTVDLRSWKAIWVSIEGG